MSVEENVYEEKPKTEEGRSMEMGAEKEMTDCPNASTVPGKFKDVNALVSAYESLQAEFTRRSQRLKEMERLLSEQQGEEREDGSGAEKLRKTARKKREEKKAFDAFLSEVETALQTPSPKEKEKDSSQGKESENQASMYEMNTKKSDFEEAERLAEQEGDGRVVIDRPSGGGEPSVVKNGVVDPSEALLNQIRGNEEVRLKIIGEYLRSIGKSTAPLTVGGGTAVTPPIKASTIQDAGKMALQYFRNSAKF